MAERQLDILEERIEKLESLVFGAADKDSVYPKDECPQLQCIDSLAKVQGQVQTSVTGKRRIAQAYERIPQLEQYLDPENSDKLTLPEDGKTEIVLAEEQFVLDQAKKLEELESLTKFMSSEHLKSVPTHAGKLQDLFQIQINQQDRTADFTAETERLLTAYNNIIVVLAKQFLHWNEIITQMEMASSKK